MSRKAVEKAVLDFMGSWEGGRYMVDKYKKRFSELSDAQFADWVEDLRTGRDFLRAVMPNFDSKRLSVEDNVKAAEVIGHSFLERIWMTDSSTGTEYLTNPEYLTMHLPLRGQLQLLFKKISIPKNNKARDVLSGQATGPSKGGSLSLPESQVLYSQKLEETLKEALKARGGDETTMQAFDRQIIETGEGDLDLAMKAGGLVPANVTTSMYLKAMHIDNDMV